MSMRWEKQTNNHSSSYFWFIILYIRNPIVKLVVLCVLFAFQTDNSHCFPFSFNAGRIGLVISQCIVNKTWGKDCGDVVCRTDDEHALTQTYSFIFFSFFHSFPCLVLCRSLPGHSYIKLFLHLVGMSEKYACVVSKISLSATTNRCNREREREGISITYIILAYFCWVSIVSEIGGQKEKKKTVSSLSFSFLSSFSFCSLSSRQACCWQKKEYIAYIEAKLNTKKKY